MAGGNHIKDFFDFVKAIGESKSKQEEDRIIADEVVHLKKLIPQTTNTKKKVKELLVRSIYVEMLGQDASFAYIKAVELCASTNIIQKRVGYLTSALCLSPSHEFRFMLVNQIQRDMNSTNHLEACAALSAVSKLVTEDMIPAVIGDVLKLIKHDMESVRKKAIGALHRFYQMDKNSVVGHLENVRRGLCDKDPSVMGATLPFLHDLVRDDVLSYKDLVPSLVSILKQITEHRLPRDYDYHRIPAPWIQMNLLRILALLGKGDQTASEGMYEVVADVMKRADTGINVGYAIVYEAVKTVTTIYPNPVLLDTTATAISRFIRSDSHNLKYIGIKGLAAIVKEHPRYAADHQMAVIDCLEDPDETLKRKTLDLLFRMTNSVNVEFIVEKLLSFLGTATDDHFRTDLVGQITQCAERYAPSNAWYVQTIIRVFELAGDKVKQSVAQTLTQLIAEGAADDDNEGQSDDDLRMDAVEDFLELIGDSKLSEILAQTMAWVLGEYGYLAQSHTKEQIMDKLCDLMSQTSDANTRCHVISALMKLVAQNGSSPTRITKLVNYFADSMSLDLQQRCLEFKALLKRSGTMVDVLPVDASCEDIDVDENLGFLQNFVNRALSNGAAPYTPREQMDDDDDMHDSKSALKITPYERPTAPPVGMGIMSNLTTAASLPQGPTPLGPALTNAAPALTGPSGQGNQLLNNRGVAQVWGKKPQVEVPPPPQQQPSAPVVPEPAKSAAAPSVATSSSMAAPAAAATAASNVPRQLTEKEKMAQALFGGVPSTTGGGVRAARQRRAATGASQPGGQQAPSPSMDMLSSAVSAAPVSAAPPSSLAPATTDFLGQEMNVAPVAVPVAAAAPPPRSAANDILDLLDFGSSAAPPAAAIAPQHFGSGIAAAPQPQPQYSVPIPQYGLPQTSMPQPPQQQAQSNNLLDAFASLNMTPGTGACPLAISTGEFGQRWGQSPVDLKQTVTSKVQTLDQLKRAMPTGYGHIESIQASLEAIFAATTSLGSIVLIHIKVFPAKMSCDVTVKSTNRDICAKELGAIATALTGYIG